MNTTSFKKGKRAEPDTLCYLTITFHHLKTDTSGSMHYKIIENSPQNEMMRAVLQNSTDRMFFLQYTCMYALIMWQ